MGSLSAVGRRALKGRSSFFGSHRQHFAGCMIARLSARDLLACFNQQ
jgi:hypothetical protein